MAKGLDGLLQGVSAERLARIEAMADEVLMECRLQRLREELELSQKELAAMMGIKQPTLSALEQRGADVKLSTMKKYVEAMGGTMRIDVELPTGKHVGFRV